MVMHDGLYVHSLPNGVSLFCLGQRTMTVSVSMGRAPSSLTRHAMEFRYFCVKVKFHISI